MVSVGGLASGLDTNNIINQLIELERRPIEGLQRQIAQIQQVQATFSGLTASFASLRAAGNGLSFSSLQSPTVSVSDDSAVRATASAAASPGRHEISVAQLATSNRITSQGFTDSDATPISGVAGTFTVQVGASGAQVSVAVTTSTTLLDLANAINAAEGDVRASVIDDGTNDLEFRLVLTSTRTGRANDIRILANTTDLELGANAIEAASADDGNAGTYTGTATSSGTYTGTTNKTYIVEVLGAGAVGVATYRYSTNGGVTWNDNGGAGFSTSAVASAIGGNAEGVDIAFSAGGTLSVGDRFYVDASTPVLQAAQDAVFSIDGITQTRSSNSVIGALSGVTLDLQQVTASPVTLTVARDDEQIVTAARELVDAYNGIFRAVREEQSFDSETLEAGILLGDRTANTLLSRLRQTLSRTIPGTDSVYDSLASIGITSGRTGELSLDTTQLREAIADDREGVVRVLSSSEQTSTSQLAVVSRPRERADGTYSINITSAPERATVAAGGAQSDTLGSAENLSFTYSSNQSDASPSTSTFSVALETGDTLGDVIDRLNSAFATQSVRLRAFASGGVLNIESTELGADMFFSVVSDVATGANTTRIGTVASSDTGVDVAGTVGGQAASGTGGRLEVLEGNTLFGLAVTYSGASTGAVGSVTISTGAGGAFSELVDELTIGTDSLVGARNAGLQEQIEDIQERIRTKEDQVARIRTRLEAQFAALEVQLSSLQSQSDFLTNQLGQLQNLGSRSRNG